MSIDMMLKRRRTGNAAKNVVSLSCCGQRGQGRGRLFPIPSTRVYSLPASFPGIFTTQFNIRSYILFVAFLSLSSQYGFGQTTIPTFENCKRCIVLSEQSLHRIAIVDLDKQAIVWDWQPRLSVKPEHLKWFNYPSDAKPVYNGRYILATASGGAVSLIRIADKKLVFYAYAGGNTHSAELLPDGNIVSASSNGNFMTVFKTDTLNFPLGVYSKNTWLPYGHNVVWDARSRLLWTAGMSQLKRFTYNFNCGRPDFTIKDSLSIIGNEAHDLFPVYGENALWLTNREHAFKVDPRKRTMTTIPNRFYDIKSLSSGPRGFPTLVIYAADVKKGWWTDEVLSLDGKSVFKQSGLKIYKARWFVENKFSYRGKQQELICTPD